MWERVEPADLVRARANLGQRLVDTRTRHDEEIKTLQAKHTEGIRVLEDKQAELASLEAQIERFASEFQATDLAFFERAVDQEGGTDGSNEARLEVHESGETEPAEEVHALPNGATKLSVAFASPNFRPFRKVAP